MNIIECIVDVILLILFHCWIN